MSTSWKARLLYSCAIWFTGVAHHNLVRDVSNTPEGMLLYHGLAAGIDFLLLVCAAHLLRGRLSNDMQILCWLSMAVNFAGWILYLAWTPPTAYNYAIGILGYVQLLRLLPVGLYVDRARHRFIRGLAAGRTQLHYEKAKS